ncbi:MAG: hypothetical protein GY755_20025 [Chloroflexi bacterium]|nr:hypothetical protein [Chloroflexota bacterium]
MNTFKSPSHYMSRGRRAWYKAHKQLNNNKIDNNTKKSENNTQTLIIPHTPIHKKVTDIAMKNERKSKLELISEIEMKDHSGDNSEQNSEHNSVDSDEMKTNNLTDLNDDEDDDIINKINEINNNPITRLENNLENKSPSEDINFNNENENENENENNEQRRLSFTITVPSDDTLEPIQYVRSIGTQTENIQCEIGIQTYKQSILPINQNNNNNILLQNQNNNQTIITLSNGIKYVKINENINNNNNNNNVNNGSIDIDDITTANVNDNNTKQNIQQLQSLSLNIEKKRKTITN